LEELSVILRLLDIDCCLGEHSPSVGTVNKVEQAAISCKGCCVNS